MLKKTKTRENVIELLENATTPMSANDIFHKLKNDKITLSSIYRTLNTFYKEKMVIRDNIEGTAVYTLLKEDHYHYLECKVCHNKIKLDYCPYHKANNQIKKQLNFVVDEHNVVLIGTCSNCNKKR